MMDRKERDNLRAMRAEAPHGPLTAIGEDGLYPIVDRIGTVVGTGYDRPTAQFFAAAAAALPLALDALDLYEAQLAPLCELFDFVREAALAAGWKGATFPPREALATILAHERRRLLDQLGPVLAPKRTEAPYFCAECHARGDSVATIAHTDACRIGSDLAREGFPASATLERLIAKDREELVAAWREQVDTAFASECSANDARDAAIAQARRWKRLVMERRDPRVTTSEAQLRAERDAWRTAALEGRPPAREVVGAMESMRFIANRAARSTFDTLAMLETFVAAESDRCTRTVEALAVDAADAGKVAEAEALREAAAALHARREAALRGAAPEVDAIPTVARRRVVAIRAAILAHGPAPTGCMSVADDRDGSATLSLVSMDGVRRAWFVANPDGGHVVMTAPRVPGMGVRNGLPIAEQAEAARRFVGWP